MLSLRGVVAVALMWFALGGLLALALIIPKFLAVASVVGVVGVVSYAVYKAYA